MNIMLLLSNLMIPLTFAVILICGYAKRVNVYETFIDGAKGGFSTVVNIAPTILGLIVSVGVIRASGALDILTGFFAPLLSRFGFPAEALPLTAMRLVSSSASTGLLLDIYENHGPDSFIGRFVSIMMSSTETVVYTLSVYFMSIGITKMRYTLHGALLANFTGVVASLLITFWLFG